MLSENQFVFLGGVVADRAEFGEEAHRGHYHNRDLERLPERVRLVDLIPDAAV